MLQTATKHTFCVSITFFPPKNRDFYEIMWKNVVQPDRPWRMRIACWTPKATREGVEYVETQLFWRTAPPPQIIYNTTGMMHLNTWGYKHTLRTCNIYYFSTATMVVRTRHKVTLCVNWLSCSIIILSVLLPHCLYYVVQSVLYSYCLYH